MTDDKPAEAVGVEVPDPAGTRPSVILLEDPRDTGYACSLLSRGGEKTSLIASSPAACWELEKQGLPFRPIENFSVPSDLSAIGMDNYRKVDELCGKIDRTTRELGLVPEGALQYPATDNFFPIKILYDGLTIRARILMDLGRSVSPGTVFAFRHCLQESPLPRTGPFHPDESICARLLGMPGWPFQTVVVPIPLLPGAVHPTRAPRRRGLPSPLEGAGPSLLSDLAFLLKRGRQGDALSLPLFGLRNRLLSAERLMIAGFGYSWNDIIPALSSGGYSITHWQPAMISPEEGGGAPVGQALDRVLESVIPRYLTLGKIDIAPLLKEKLKLILEEYLQLAPLQAEEIQGRLARVRPRAVLCGTKSTWRDHLLARCAKARGIPVISWQHGAQGFFRAPMMRYVELNNSDTHLCFGEKVREMVKREFRGEPPQNVIPVGSYQLQELAMDTTEAPREFEVIYATTSYLHNNLYVGGIGEEVFQDIDFWETQRSILEVLGKSGRKTVFKLHPGDSQSAHLREFLSEKGFPYITVVKNERSYTDLVRHAGAVVLDCPSTTLLEAVATKRDVLVLLKHVRLTEDATELLRKRAYLTEDRKGFTRLLAQYLRGEETGQHPDPGNTEFLEAYGVRAPDGKVEERALSVIRGLPGEKDRGKIS